MKKRRKGTTDRAPGPFGIFTALFTCGPHIENADLPEVGARLKGGEHRLPVVGHHLQSAPVHYVHLLSHLTCNQAKSETPVYILELHIVIHSIPFSSSRAFRLFFSPIHFKIFTHIFVYFGVSTISLGNAKRHTKSNNALCHVFREKKSKCAL